MEQAIRPFQLSEFTFPFPLPTTGRGIVTPQPFLIGDGALRTETWSTSASMKVTTNKYKETKRDEVKRRVYDPNDSSQFIDIMQLKVLYLQNKKDKSDTRVYELKVPDQAPPPADGG